MPAPRRQPLGELPLSLFIDHDNHGPTAKPVGSKRSTHPAASLLLSPPKRRMAIVQGTLAPSPSESTKALLESMRTPVATRAHGTQRTPSFQPSASSSTLLAASPSLRSSSSRMPPPSSPVISITPTEPYSYAKPPRPYAVPTTPSASPAIVVALAPSPEINESPSPSGGRSSRRSSTSQHMESSPVFTRQMSSTPTPTSLTPSSLKRTRESSPGSPSFVRSQSPAKRRNNPPPSTLAPTSLDALTEDMDDKENVPLPRRKARAPESPKTTIVKDIPKIVTRHRRGPSFPFPTALSQARMKYSRSVLEAEVDEPEGMDVDM